VFQNTRLYKVGGVKVVALVALMGNRDLIILYELGVTLGCGTELRILHIVIY